MDAVGPLISPLLVGRDDLLDLADRRLDEVANGRGQFLLLAGESGIGKTRLLNAISGKAVARGFRVSGGAVAPQDRDVPAAAVLDLARNLTHERSFDNLGPDLLQLRQAAATAESGRRRMLVIDIVDRITAELGEPTLLAFEDLQWADDLSLEIASELARQTRDRPLLLVGIYRSDEDPPGSTLREWRSRLLTQRMAEEARLQPLDLPQTALVTTLILDTGLPAPRDVVQAVYERTDGIPLHIEELLGAINAQARADGRAIREATVPDTIEDAVIERIGRCSADAQAVARAGAVIGRCFVPEVLAGIMDLPPEALDEPLQELVDRFVLDMPGLRGLYDFRHQLLRDALYRTIPTADRRVFHARAAEFGARLEGASEIHASVHFERAGMREQAFVAAIIGARDAAGLSAHREAFELYRRAVENLPDDLKPGARADLYEAYLIEAAAIEENEIAVRMAYAARDDFLASGRPVKAAAMFDQVLGIWRRDARPLADRWDMADRLIKEFGQLTEDPEFVQAHGSFLNELARLHLESLAFGPARSAVTAMRAVALTADDPTASAEADVLGAMIQALEGDIGEGLDAISTTARSAQAAGFEDSGVTAFRDAATIAVRVMDYPRAARSLAEGLRYADAIQQSHCAHVMGATSALVAWADGDWSGAVTQGSQAIADYGCRRAVAMARWPIGYVALGRGDYAAADGALSEALSVGKESGTIELILPALWGLAEAALLAGDPDLASDHCRAAFARSRQVGECALLAPFVVTGVRAEQAAGRPDAAERWLAECIRAMADSPWSASPALAHGKGLVALRAGATGIARQSLEAAVRGWDELGRIWEATWARLDLAACLTRSSLYGEAATLASVAQDVAARLDSPPLAARADALRRLARGHVSTDEPWRPLTAREFAVARLITEGLTNGEIADALGIAPKTASSHVEHILAKLGASRRAEIAAWASHVDRIPAPH